MKTIRQIQAEEQLSFIWNVILLDFARILFIWYCIYVVCYFIF